MGQYVKGKKNTFGSGKTGRNCNCVMVDATPLILRPVVKWILRYRPTQLRVQDLDPSVKALVDTLYDDGSDYISSYESGGGTSCRIEYQDVGVTADDFHCVLRIQWEGTDVFGGTR